MELIRNMNVIYLLLLWCPAFSYSFFDVFGKSVIEEKATSRNWYTTTTSFWTDFYLSTRSPKVDLSYPSTRFPSEWGSRGAPSTPYPCLYGVCNGTCCKSESIDAFFDCANGQKINRTLVCNRENDCDDGSDESICDPWPPKMTVLPQHKVEVFCGDDDRTRAGTLILECKSVGFPTPLVRWKKYEGHVPTKCQQYSKHGHGILTCPDFQQSDQGAYSCVAENSVKSAESQPKAIAKCSNTINCGGFRVVNEDKIEHCLECFCSGRTNQCQNIKSNPTVIKIPLPERKTEIFVDDHGKVLFLPTETELTPSSSIRQSSVEVSYYHMTKGDLQGTSFLKSFGRNIIIPMSTAKGENIPKAPTLIIRGNGLSLMYTAKLITPPKDGKMSARLWPGNWHHLNNTAATRADLMRLLCDVDILLIRCEYELGITLDWNLNATVLIESSIITDSSNSVSYVEKCYCPSGYDGLSCETCAGGYEKIAQGDSFYCKKIYVPPPCEPGYLGVNCTNCDTLNGYIRRGNACIKPSCNPVGSISTILGLSGKCSCKAGFTGDFCDQCQVGYFNSSAPKGCDKCWCSGVTNLCNSSILYRTLISNVPRGGYNYSDGRNFWLLPPDFSGNRLTSYGGFLNYTMTYKPNLAKEKHYLTVEFLSAGDVTLSYTHSTMDTSLSSTEKSWSVPLTEANWRKTDRSPVNKGEFLTVLSRIKAIYIESPYHLSSGKATLKSILMSSASPVDDGSGELASQVERCICPEGYAGLSCESCSDGYYKKRNGTMTMCLKCNCTNCDPDFGCPVCPALTYRDNPEEEKMPVCKPCPCENAVSCVKDDYNQIFCRCKPGFTGMHCEYELPDEKDELTITISPRNVRGKKVGTKISFNCSVFTSEEMVLTAKKNFGSSAGSVLMSGVSSTSSGRKISSIFEVQMEDGLKSVECFVRDEKGALAGHIIAKVDDLVHGTQKVEITNCYSDKIDVKESEGKDLICEAKGLPTPMINWYRKVGSKVEKVDTTDGVHTIEKALLSDNGTVYTCIAENSRGDKATCSSVLVVRKKCEIINVPKEVRIIEGRNATIECRTTAKSQVTWTKLNPLTGAESSFFPYRITVSAGVLRIRDATISDSGPYVCSAIGENGKINGTVLVTVEEQQEPPSVTIEEYDTTLKVGENFTAHCKVSGKPTPKLNWKKVNGVLEKNVYVAGNNLRIIQATTENAGIYACDAYSSLGTANSFISINVEFKAVQPTLNISKNVIRGSEGEVVNLSCVAAGYPQPKLSWNAPNIPVLSSVRMDNGTALKEPYELERIDLSFKIAKHMDGSRVYCTAENSAGRAEVAAKVHVYQAKESINQTAEFIRIGSYFEISCRTKVTVFDKITVDKVNGLVGDECPTPSGLLIPSVQIQHNGTYHCKVRSEVKEIIHLFVIGYVPKFSKPFSSYLVLPVPLNSTNQIHIEMAFKPTKENGVLLQKTSGKFNIYLQEGKLVFDIHTEREGLKEFLLKNPLQPGKWYSLVASVDRSHFDVTVYGETMSILERKTENTQGLSVNMESEDNFFVGGPVPKAGFAVSGRIRRPRPIQDYFDGCISRLIIDHHEYDIVKEGSYSYNVTLCRQCDEKPNPCLDGGVCFEAPTQYGFVCVCPEDDKKRRPRCSASCTARGCETKFDLCTMLKPCKAQFQNTCETRVDKLLCQCPYGYSGTLCEKAQEYSFCSKGTGYIRLQSNLLERYPGKPEVIKMKFRLSEPDGQLLWQGDKANHLSISVHQGMLKYVYFNQHSRLEIKEAKIKVNTNYSFTLTRSNGTATLEIEQAELGKLNYRSAIPKYHTNRVVGDIYLGKVPKDSLQYHNHAGLNGCIYYVAFGTKKKKINLPQMAMERVNVTSALLSTNSDEEDYSSNELDKSTDLF